VHYVIARAKKIDFRIFGKPTPMMNIFSNLFYNFQNVTNMECVKNLEKIKWPVYGENMIACFMIQRNMSLKYIV
jgi:hypothetical protein